MRASLDITIERHEYVGSSCPSDVTFKVFNFKNDNPLMEINLKGIENVDYLIPLGIYEGRLLNSPKFREYAISIIVPRQPNVTFCIGNSPADSKGCILVGLDAPSPSFVSESSKAICLLDAIFQTYKIIEIIVYVDNVCPF